MRLLLSLCFCLYAGGLFAQFQEDVFPNLSGQELLDALVSEYKPAFTLTDAASKDTLYARIFARQDSVRCVYTDHAAYLTPGEDPSQAVFVNDINVEHTYPKSKGTDNIQAERDMHHLFPSKANVNNDRASNPFLEINDNQTERWYRYDQTLNNPPSSNIDAYSEAIINESFEPRESVKGDIARAMFYIFTMYNQEVMAADPDFFEIQRLTLCQWHYLDPVDADEWERNQRIATYQDGKPNPFILDCTLPSRCHCADVPPGNCLTDLDPQPDLAPKFKVSPNPAFDLLQIDWSNLPKGDFQLRLLSTSGQVMYQQTALHLLDQALEIKLSDIPAGLYTLQLIHTQAVYSQQLTIIRQ